MLTLILPIHVHADENSDEISNAAKSLSSSVASSLTSDYAYAFDYDTDQILLDKKSEEKIYPASTTKMLTLLTALNNGADLSDQVTITEDMLRQGCRGRKCFCGRLYSRTDPEPAGSVLWRDHAFRG